MPETRYYSTGKRKAAVARCWLIPGGNGQITVNRRPVDTYFCRENDRNLLRQPMVMTDTVGKFDVMVTVRGGGPSGQAGAIRHGIARALQEYNAEFRQSLKKAGLLTRDARKKERKKYGQPGARKRYQFSKR